MRALPAAILVAASLLSCTSCARSAPPGVTIESAAPEASSTTTWRSEAPVTLEVGKPTDLSETRGLAKAVVTVESITENATCPSGLVKPKNGQFIAVTITAVRKDTSEGFAMAVYDWGSLDASGKAVDGKVAVSTGLCIQDGTALKLDWDPSGRDAGTLIIDAPKNVTALTATNNMVSPAVTVTLAMPAR